MVRIAAITASLLMSSQVGGNGRAHDVGSEREFQREQDPGGEFQPDLAALHLVGGALQDQPDDAAERLYRAEGHDKNRRGLDGERHVAGDVLEIVLDEYGPVPPGPRLARALCRRNRNSGWRYPRLKACSQARERSHDCDSPCYVVHFSHDPVLA